MAVMRVRRSLEPWPVMKFGWVRWKARRREQPCRLLFLHCVKDKKYSGKENWHHRKEKVHRKEEEAHCVKETMLWLSIIIWQFQSLERNTNIWSLERKRRSVFFDILAEAAKGEKEKLRSVFLEMKRRDEKQSDPLIKIRWSAQI